MTNEAETLDFGMLAARPIIDGHLHVWKGYHPSQIWQTLEKVGVQRCNALSLNNFDRGGTLNAEALAFKKASSGAAFAFGSLDYTRHLQGEKMRPEDLTAQAEHIQALGFDGIKMWEGKPLAYIVLPDRLSGEFFTPFFAWAEVQAFPIILHLADAPRFWDPSRKGLDFWSYAGEPYPSRQAMYRDLEELLTRHPRLKLILAHFLFLWDELDEARRMLESYPSIAFDLTPGVEGFALLSRSPAAARQFFLDFQDRLIYGSDIGALPLLNPDAGFDLEREAGQPWLVRAFLETRLDIPFPPRIGLTINAFPHERLRGIGLPAPALDQIYRLNFERMVAKTPAQV